MLKVLFVCTGNSCRSPMAELYFNHIARERKLDVVAASAGIYANDGGPISRGAAAVMGELGIDVSEFRSTAFTPLRAGRYDMLIGMTRTHAALMNHIAPDVRPKVCTLVKGEDVPVPFGGGVEEYRKVFEFMRPFLDQLLKDFSI